MSAGIVGLVGSSLLNMVKKSECGLILAAAGSGSRFGSDVPKQFLELHGKPVYLLALEAFLPFVCEAVVVVPASMKAQVQRELDSCDFHFTPYVAIGGDRRQDSVESGLGFLGMQVKSVLVHDAARPFASEELIGRVVEGTLQYGACIPILPVCDTVKVLEADFIVKTLDRGSLGLAQTPQGFERGLLEEAFSEGGRLGIEATDEAALVEHLGYKIRVVAGDKKNVKITWQSDLG